MHFSEILSLCCMSSFVKLFYLSSCVFFLFFFTLRCSLQTHFYFQQFVLASLMKGYHAVTVQKNLKHGKLKFFMGSFFLNDLSIIVHWSEDILRRDINEWIFWHTSPTTQRNKAKMDPEFFVSHVKGLHSETNIVEWDTVGIRAKNKMIEIFNLGLNSSASKNEMQTKLPFGEKDMDYKILLLVYRDRDNHSAVWYPVVLDATVCFLFKKYAVTLISFPPFCRWHLLRSRHVFFLLLQPQESFYVTLPALQHFTRNCICFRLWIPVA